MNGLRWAALTAVLCGQAAVCLAEILPGVLLPVTAALTVGGAVAAARSRDRRAVVLRHAATVISLLLALVMAPRLAGGGGGLREVLGPLLVGVASAQSLTWQARRDVQTGVLCAGGLLVLGASFAPDVLVGLPLLVGWWATLVAGVLASRERAREQVDVVLQTVGPRSPVVTAAALAAALGLVAFLLVPVPEDASLRSRLAAATSSNTGRAAPGAYTGGRVDLRVRGELGDAVLVEVPADSPQLWRSGVYSDWDGTGWTVPGEGRRVLGPPFEVAPATGPTRTDDVEVQQVASGPVWSPGPVVSVQMRGRAAFVDGYGAVQGFTAPRYAVTSAVVAPSLQELRAATGRDENDPRWTALPAALPERVRSLGLQLAGGAPTRADAVLAVERWLRDNARYDLDSPVPGPGEDAVDRFLFVDRVGFCEQFAAAEVLLLRAAGIPARFVTGMGYGVDAGSGRRSFRQKDLHAWAEVFHPGLGWVPSDPTPPSTQLADASWRVRAAARLSAALRAADDVPGGRPALASGVLVLLAAVAVALLVRRRRPRVPQGPTVAPQQLTGRPALAAFLRYDARLGPRRRRPAESLEELRRRLDPPEPLSSALQAVEDECYAPAPPVAAATAAGVLDRS